MSRRSRRRAGRFKTPWVGRVLIGSFLVIILGVAVLFFAIRSYLHGERFRHFLSEQVGDALDGDADFGVFHWHGRLVRADSFTVENSKGPVRGIKADGLGVEIGLGGWSRGVWELNGGLIRHLDAIVDFTTGDARVPSSPKAIRKHSTSWLPDKVELSDAEISNVDLRAIMEDGTSTLTGMRVRAQADGAPDSYVAVLNGGVLQLPFEAFPAVDLGEANLRINRDTVFLKSLTASAWGGARLDATGEWNIMSKDGVIDGRIRDVPTSEMLPENWIKKVSGKVEVDFTARLGDRSPRAEGEIRLENGVLTALPVLDVLAAYADTSRFRILTLHDARCKWNWRNGVWRFSDLVLFSEGLARLEGSLTIDGDALDGRFRLGIPKGTLSHIPGAESAVFLPGEHGLMWAPIRIAGTLDHPEEDLTDRLLLAAGLRIFDDLPGTGEKVLKFTNRIAEDVAPKAIREGLQIIDENRDVIDAASGILEGILGKPEQTPDLPLMPRR